MHYSKNVKLLSTCVFSKFTTILMIHYIPNECRRLFLLDVPDEIKGVAAWQSQGKDLKINKKASFYKYMKNYSLVCLGAVFSLRKGFGLLIECVGGQKLFILGLKFFGLKR